MQISSASDVVQTARTMQKFVLTARNPPGYVCAKERQK